jgi:hypothetical protein
MRPYVPGEDTAGVSVVDADLPLEEGGMLAFDPDRPAAPWYVSRKYFEENFEPMERGDDPDKDKTTPPPCLADSGLLSASAALDLIQHICSKTKKEGSEV